MRSADLHLHSVASDGALTPTALVEFVASRGLHALSLTDHDTVDGLDEAAAAAARSGSRFVPGLELSVTHEGQDLHILAYFIDPTHRGLRRLLGELRLDRESRLTEMLRRLAACGVSLSEEQVKAIAEPGATLGRLHVARALAATGQVTGVNEAFRLYLGDGGRAHVRKKTATPEEALSLLCAAGAAAALAHPGTYRRVEGLMERLTPLGLIGLEVVHPMHAPDEVARYSRMAERWGLLPTGGSDYHGGREHESLPGAHCVDVSILDRLEARRGGVKGAESIGGLERTASEVPMSDQSNPNAAGDGAAASVHNGFAHARRLRFILVFVVLASGIGWLVARGAREQVHYYVTVSELLGKEPGADLRGLRLSGIVEAGSIRKEALELSFRVTDGSRSIPVDYDGVVPDTFAEEGEVVVEGVLGSDGVFRANFLMAKCPSKYEVDPEDMKPEGI